MVDYVKIEEEEQKETPQKKKKMKFSFKKLLLIFLAIFILSSIISSVAYNLSPKIAVVPITGTLLTYSESGLFSSSGLTSRDIANRLYSLRDDNSVKGVILDINSPGGSAVASEEISMAIESLKQVKPVYALVNDVGASGAFWVAVEADKVYASSMSMLGSIGVTSAGLSFEHFIANYNITYRKQTAGEYKDMGSIFREPTVQEEEILQNLLDEIHYNFISHIANKRNMSFENVSQYATGEIFLGKKAKEIGFIDEIGYFPDVVADLKEITGQDVMLVDFRPDPTLAQLIGLDSIFGFPATTTKSQILLK